MMNEKTDKFAAISPLQKKLIKLLKSRGLAKDETILFMHDFKTDEKCIEIIDWIESHPQADVDDIFEQDFRMRGLI